MMRGKKIKIEFNVEYFLLQAKLDKKVKKSSFVRRTVTVDLRVQLSGSKTKNEKQIYQNT